MCKHTYHHYPSCGHIANWTVVSCIEFTNSLREKPAGQTLSCKKTEETHDLLPLRCPTLCFQCERDWQEQIKQKGLLQGCGKDNVSIEGLGCSAPIIEVQAKSSFGAKTRDLDDGKGGIRDLHKQNHRTNNPEDQRRKSSLSPLPPSRSSHISRPSMSKRKRKRPAPIVTDAYQVERSSFDMPTPTPTPRTARTVKPAYSSFSSNLPTSDPATPSPTKTYGIYDWIPLPAPASGTLPSSLSFNYSPGSAYSADTEGIPSVSPVSASPLLPFVPRPEEYGSFNVTLGNKGRGEVAKMPRLPAQSFRNGLCIAFPRFFGQWRWPYV